MPVIPQEGGNLLGGREIKLLAMDESRFPELSSLCYQHNFRILELRREGQTAPVFVIVTREYRTVDTAAITPAFASLEQLESHARRNRENILNNFLFGFVDDDINLANARIGQPPSV